MTTRDKGITLPQQPTLFVAGNLTLSNAINTTVAASAIVATSTVVITPTNAAAASLMGGVKSLYVSAKTVGVSFTLTTANGVAAAGGETFSYVIFL